MYKPTDLKTTKKSLSLKKKKKECAGLFSIKRQERGINTRLHLVYISVLFSKYISSTFQHFHWILSKKEAVKDIFGTMG